MNQSGFKQRDSCINQLLSITHDIYQSLDQGYEVRGVFLDNSKAFDKVWHKGLIHKLKQNGIGGPLLKILTDFLKSRKQRVVLNGQHSSWSDVLAGVPQGSILGPLLFLIYINDLSDGLQCNPKLFADDTSLFATVHNIKKATNDLNNDLTKITKWAFQWKMSFNPDISKQAHEVIFFPQKVFNIHPPSTFNNIPVAQRNSPKKWECSFLSLSVSLFFCPLFSFLGSLLLSLFACLLLFSPYSFLFLFVFIIINIISLSFFS